MLTARVWYAVIAALFYVLCPTTAPVWVQAVLMLHAIGAVMHVYVLAVGGEGER